MSSATERVGGSVTDLISRIDAGLSAARQVLERFIPGEVRAQTKSSGDPVTEADRAVDRILKRLLVQEGEGWLSEETVDDRRRLERRRVWIVDPLDGTREFVSGVPEWAVSIGYVVDGVPVAGGVCNPQTGESFLGGVGFGVRLGGVPVVPSSRGSLDGAVVLASRSEYRRGEWARFTEGTFEVRPVGSVAYKLALVAAGLADATWTLQPKNEWDVAGGIALILAAGGVAYTPDGTKRSFNSPSTLMDGLIAHPPSLTESVRSTLGIVPAS